MVTWRDPYLWEMLLILPGRWQADRCQTGGTASGNVHRRSRKVGYLGCRTEPWPTSPARVQKPNLSYSQLQLQKITTTEWDMYSILVFVSLSVAFCHEKTNVSTRMSASSHNKSTLTQNLDVLLLCCSMSFQRINIKSFKSTWNQNLKSQGMFLIVLCTIHRFMLFQIKTKIFAP